MAPARDAESLDALARDASQRDASQRDASQRDAALPDAMEDGGTHRIGEMCTRDEDCGDGERCNLDFFNGYCTASCETAPCPPGGTCINAGGHRSCFKRCEVNDDCRFMKGYSCAARICVPP